MNYKDLPPEVVSDLWLVRFGEVCLWDDAVRANAADPTVDTMYTLLTQSGRLWTTHPNGVLHIFLSTKE